ncbi:hypothetical protein HIM_00256 [Hirsutella minnesotensis 3608]|nr:hypothetical protein HIM_00256 [Hirsutella minnesotensis 3608]
MTIHGSWSSRLKSVKFEFDTTAADLAANDPALHDIVFENPLPFDIPGVPRRCVFESPRSTCSCRRSSETPSSDGAAFAKAPKNQPSKDQGPDFITALNTSSLKPTQEHVRRGRLVGESCDLDSMVTCRSKVAALISTAWAMVRSQQDDTSEVEFNMILPERSSDSHVVLVSLDRHRPIADILTDAATRLEQLSSNPTSERQQSSEETRGELSPSKSVLVVRDSNTCLDGAVIRDFSLVLDCIVDQRAQELIFTAIFDEARVQRKSVRFVLSDLEHIVWQMLQAQATGLCLRDLETVGPVSQRAMRRLNRPLQPKFDCLLHHMILRHVVERPEADAVDAWDGRLTYAQLEEQSNCLANHLVNLGVGPETFVPIIFEKSKMRIVATLAVIKAGGAFMPLDPRLPQARLHTMVVDAGSWIAITSETCRGRMPTGVEEVVLNETRLVEMATSHSQGACASKTSASPDNALYLMFTSGSTGKPKGVVISHASFCSSASGFKDAIQLSSPNRRSLHFASSGFDASIMETLVTLLVGACICIPSDEERLDNVAKCIADFQVDWAFLTPTVARLLRPEDVPGLKTLCLGGEALPKDLVEIWGDKVSVVNAYGPTECSIVAVVSDPIPKASQAISLGRPRGCAAWILNDEGTKIQSFNTTGEIVLEGPGVARGYLNDEFKTAAVFGDNAPFLDGIAGSTARFYKTGDLGRMNPDGTIDYFGRKDTQVKINGQRIEIGEIEHHVKSWMNRRDEVDDVDVVVELLRPGNGSRTLLVAFVGPGQDATANRTPPRGAILESSHATSRDIFKRARGMKGALLDKLTAYMIPGTILPCDGIPRMASGKTDRKTLRHAGNALTAAQIKQMQLSVSSDDVPKSVSSEQLMRGIWAQILELPEDSILADDDFFMLGGDSIGLIKIVAACRLTGVSTSVSALSECTLLHEMGKICEPSRCEKAWTPSKRRAAFGMVEPELADSLCEEAAIHCDVDLDLIEDIYPCTGMQEELMVANVMHPGVSVGRFIHRLPDDIDIERFKTSWQTVHKETPILRTRFTNAASAGSLQVVIDEPIAWRHARSLESYVEADDAEAMLPGSALSRFALIFRSQKEVYFVWTMHHMLYDGWSVSLICKRVNVVYNGVATTPASDFREFVAYSEGLDKERTTRYWQKQLKGVTASAFPGSTRPNHACRASSIFKDKLELPQQKEQLKATMSTMIQAAWAIMISHQSNTNDVLFGSTISGRNAPVEGIDNIEGPTLATVPIRLRLCPESRAVEFLHLVRDHYIEMIPYEQTGLKHIRSISEDAARACDFQNLLVIQSSSVWEENAEPLGPPSHKGEDATVPLLCQVWLSPKAIDFDVIFDEEITSREHVANAISTVKEVLMKLFQLSDTSSMRLADVQPRRAPDSVEDLDGQAASPLAVQETIHGLIQEVSANRNEDEALCASGFSMSYKELDKLSSKLALHLLQMGIRSGVILPLCFEKSVSTVIAMLAALKTGSAFVLLDPSQPQKRLEELVSQVEAHHVLMSPLQAASRSFGDSVRHEVLDMNLLSNLPSVKAGQLPKVSPDELAYMIFTSGSTGRPKGVMISHSAFASSSTAYAQALGLESGRRVLQFSSYSFDASLNEILVVLMHGGVVCVASDTERVEDLAGFIRRERVDWAILTPSVARLLSPNDVPQLETLDLGGEAPDQALLARWHHAGVRVFNVYGPAEGAGTSLSQRYRDDIDARAIGRPMGCRVWIVEPDDHDKLLKRGDTGELLLEGPILASGYFKDPEKTAKSFISNPVWAMRSDCQSMPRRMYKTGDLVFTNGDGSLIYVGRKDLQVKHHGQRIELGDIETNLATCQGIESCAVFYPSSGPFGKQLTAIVKFETKNEIRDRARCARADLAAKLPSSMIPAYWLEMTAFTGEGKSLPLSLSGKIDRRLITSRLEQLSTAEAAKAFAMFDHDESQDNVGGESICEGEQPAYALAQKIHTMLPSRVRISLANRNESESPAQSTFEDLVLQSSGLDSLNMMSLMYFIAREFKANISMQLLMDKNTTIRKLAERIRNSQAVFSTRSPDSDHLTEEDTATVDVLAEIDRHDSQIAAIQQRHRAQQSAVALVPAGNVDNSMTVLLTGGNGFIGTQVLRQLLENRLVKTVIAVVRGQTVESARNRTIEAARRALWWTDLHAEKLQVWSGDLSLPRLGLDDSNWDALNTGLVDVIIHNGAAVHWAKSYAALEAANVRSAVELLGLAAKAPRMKFVYVTGGRDGDSPEDTDEAVARELSGADAVGYSQTKFVAEVLTKRAAQRCRAICGVDRFSVISPGLVIGTPTEGVANVDDYIWRLAAACIRLGSYSATQADTWVQMADATTMAAAIVNAGLESQVPGATPRVVRHVRDGMRWKDFWAVLMSMGYQLEARNAEEWLTAARNDIELCKESHPLWPLAHMLESQVMQEDGPDTASEIGETPERLKMAVKRNAEFLASVGWLPSPADDARCFVQAKSVDGTFSRSRV